MNTIGEEPLAVIKIKFDELSPDLKNDIYILIGACITYLILINILLFSKLVYFYYSKVKKITCYRDFEDYEQL